MVRQKQKFDISTPANIQPSSLSSMVDIQPSSSTTSTTLADIQPSSSIIERVQSSRQKRTEMVQSSIQKRTEPDLCSDFQMTEPDLGSDLQMNKMNLKRTERNMNALPNENMIIDLDQTDDDFLNIVYTDTSCFSMDCRSYRAKIMANKRMRMDEVEIIAERESAQHSMKSMRESRRSLYDKAGEYKNVLLYQLSDFQIICKYCNATHFIEEFGSSNGFLGCCSYGNFANLSDLIGDYPDNLKSLFSPSNVFYKPFIENIRWINNSFACCSLSCNKFKFNTAGPYCFKISGNIYHKFNIFAQPNQEDLPTNGQLYFIDSADSIDIRKQTKSNLNAELLEYIETVMRENYPYAKSYRFMQEVYEEQKNISESNGVELPEVKMLFNVRSEYDPRRYNIPISNEIFAIVVTNASDEIPAANVVVHLRGSKELQNIYPLSKCVEPMTYPIFYPNKTQGWDYNIKDKRQKNISLCDFVKFRLYVRSDCDNFLPHHYGKKLFQQWVVDQYARIEWQRLQYIRKHQKEICQFTQKGIFDYLSNKAGQSIVDISKIVSLPSSYQGSPQNMHQNFLDAMAIMNRAGKPEYFITFTCNPNDNDIQKCLLQDQTASDRPDIVARVFYLKVKKLLEEIIDGNLFGLVTGYTWVWEVQKRGLPHIHLLLSIANKDKKRSIDEIDKIISAEFPLDDEPELFSLVSKFMVHGPCNENSPCFNKLKNKCNKKFPKIFREQTEFSEDGYPNYKRSNNGCCVYKKGVRLTNEFVVPHNRRLLKRFNAHINVEHVSDIRAVKYLYKYIFKGLDAGTVECVADGNKILKYDEVSNFLEGRCISPVEACWRIFKFPMQEKSHAVERLPVHLDGENLIYCDVDADESEIEDKIQKTSKLDAYYKFMEENPDVNFLYTDMPEKCTWHNKKGEWKLRKGKGNKKFGTIGRLHSVDPKDIEKYHLRFLLLHVPAIGGKNSLKIFNGISYQTFAEACVARGLVHNDEEWKECLREASIFRFPTALRALFCTILVHCSPKFPELLWNEFKDDLAYDLIKIYSSKEKAYQQTLFLINQKLIKMDKSLSNFEKMPQLTGLEDKISEENIFDPKEEEEKSEEMINKMNEGQKSIIDLIRNFVEKDKKEQLCLYLDGPGGTGKSFVLKSIFHLARARKLKIMNMAFSGIAATELYNGKTVHSTFKLPLNVDHNSRAGIAFNTQQAQDILNTDIFIWDEAPMASRFCLEAIDKFLKDLTKCNKIFGGKTFILSGDNRQTLPIKKFSNRIEINDLLIKNSILWNNFIIMRLSENMRADPSQQKFSSDILEIGNGLTNPADYFNVPEKCISKNNLVDEIFSDIFENKNYSELGKRAILSPFNDDVDRYNLEAINVFPGESHAFYSIDEQEDKTGFSVPVEILNALKCNGLPNHELILKKDCIVMILRNLDVEEGLVNGTRIQVLDFTKNVIRGRIVNGFKAGHEVFIPRIKLIEDKSFPFILYRHQFPIRLAFAFTFNKSQAQTFDKVGIDFTRDVFAHGQTYTAISRARSWDGITVNVKEDKKIKNIVWYEALI